MKTAPFGTITPAFWDHFSLNDVRAWTEDSHQRMLDLLNDLSDEQLVGPKLATVNPLLWEIGHVAWFQERWVLRHCCAQPLYRKEVDDLYNSATIPHDHRWALPMLTRSEVMAYLRDSHERILERLAANPGDVEIYFHLLSLFHKDMHNEAVLIDRQTWGFARPRWSAAPAIDAGPCPGDVEVPGGNFLLGSTPDEPFVFDNEKWAHSVELPPFRIARTPVTQAEFVEFVEDGGYQRREFWTDDGWNWREKVDAAHPVYWQRDGDGWRRREFDQWVRLEPHCPVINVCWHEAMAYCRWARRRLPSEAEWEAAAALSVAEPLCKRRFPWGDNWPKSEQANLGGERLGCVDVGAYSDSDSPFGCRQMIGNVWEWTASEFAPYPGFVIDPYKEYSQPWFHTHKVLRGGCWATRGYMLRNTWRNFYEPHRRDVWAGFRTCALDD